MRHGLWALALVVGAAQAAALRSTLDEQKALAITVYNGDLALVKDTRQVELPAGQSVLELRRGMVMEQMAAKADAGGMQEESLLDYHLYTLGRPITLADQQTKQVALLNAPTVKVSKEYRLAGAEYYYASQTGEIGRALKVAMVLHLGNTKAAGLGLPLPAGVVRVYQPDASGGVQFVGEDRIDHTPENETTLIKLGDAFDVTAHKTQTDFKALAVGKDDRPQFESAYRVELKNAKKTPVTVTVLEPIPGDWRVLESSLPQDKADANTARWRVTVPAGGGQTLAYRVRVRF